MSDDPFEMHLKVSKFKKLIDNAETWEELEKICIKTFKPPEAPKISEGPYTYDPYSPKYGPMDYSFQSPNASVRNAVRIVGTSVVDDFHYKNSPGITQARQIQEASENLLGELFKTGMVTIDHIIEPMDYKRKTYMHIDVLPPRKKI